MPRYRADIDGLRAIAVLLVVAFHAFPKEARGGFVGVDIFFVISGYLITNIIVAAAESGLFSFADFYSRRARRIIPALAVVLMATAAAGWLFLLPWTFVELGRQLLAGALFVENALLLGEVGYFDRAADLKPLLHLWSLAIEEQFYLLWPMVVVLVLKARWNVFALCAAVFIVSFAANVWIVNYAQPAAFYLPFTRFWELMAGAILVVPLAASAKPWVRETVAWGGSLAIAVAVATIDTHARFPGWWALLPVSGATALIWAGDATFIARHVLRRPMLVGLGLISYPLYLWHWPILSIARNVSLKSPTDLERVGCVLLAVALAHLTFRFVEIPIRGMALRRRAVAAMAGSLVAVGALGVAIVAWNGWPARFPQTIQALATDYRAEADREMRADECFLASPTFDNSFPTSCDPDAKQNAVVLWGDSYAAAFFPGLRSVSKSLPGQYTMSGCPPVFGFDSSQRLCSAVAEKLVGRIAVLKPDTVILAARWTLYDGRNGWGTLNEAMLAATAQRLRSVGVNHMIVVGQFPMWTVDVPKIIARLFLQGADTEWSALYLDAANFTIDTSIARAAQAMGAEFISPLTVLCRDRACRLTIPRSDGVPTTYDNGHLTVAASKWFAEAQRASLSP